MAQTLEQKKRRVLRDMNTNSTEALVYLAYFDLKPTTNKEVINLIYGKPGSSVSQKPIIRARTALMDCGYLKEPRNPDPEAVPDPRMLATYLVSTSDPILEHISNRLGSHIIQLTPTEKNCLKGIIDSEWFRAKFSHHAIKQAAKERLPNTIGEFFYFREDRRKGNRLYLSDRGAFEAIYRVIDTIVELNFLLAYLGYFKEGDKPLAEPAYFSINTNYNKFAANWIQQKFLNRKSPFFKPQFIGMTSKHIEESIVGKKLVDNFLTKPWNLIGCCIPSSLLKKLAYVSKSPRVEPRIQDFIMDTFM